MDFKRIEWIFVVVFFSLNLFLFSIYREGLRTGAAEQSNQTDEIETRLSKDRITFEQPLSATKKEGYYLSAEQTDFPTVIAERQAEDRTAFRAGFEFNDNTLVVMPQVLRNQVNYFIDEKNSAQSLQTFLADENNVLFGTEYSYQPAFSNFTGDRAELVAVQTYKDIPFKDDTAQLLLRLEKSSENTDVYQIEQYTQTHIQGIEELRDKMDLYSERDAIETLYVNNKIPSNATLTLRTLAYERIYKIREKNVYVPVWFIGIQVGENLQIEQVNAMNNTIITNNTIPKVENAS